LNKYFGIATTAYNATIRALNSPINVAYFSTSWSMIPDDVTLPGAAVSFVGATE
jgi:hypothetical protein